MSLDNELKSIAQAYLSMLDEKKMAKENDDEDKVECPKCKGEGCDHCDDKGYHKESIDNHPKVKAARKAHAAGTWDGNVDKEGEAVVHINGKPHTVTSKYSKKKEDNTNDKSDDGDGMDKVQPNALKKKFADRKDKDLDNDGDTDDSDEYLHNRRKAISKAVKEKAKKESVDWDAILEMTDDEIDNYIDNLPEAALNRFAKEFAAMTEAATAQMKPKPEDQEKLEPRAAAEKDWADKHTVDVKDNPETKKQDGSEKVKQAAGRKGDKRLKDVRK